MTLDYDCCRFHCPPDCPGGHHSPCIWGAHRAWGCSSGDRTSSRWLERAS